MKMLKPFPGFSIEVCFGAWARPSFRVMDYTMRLCIGFAAVTIKTYDNEAYTTALLWMAEHSTKSYSDYFNRHE